MVATQPQEGTAKPLSFEAMIKLSYTFWKQFVHMVILAVRKAEKLHLYYTEVMYFLGKQISGAKHQSLLPITSSSYLLQP